MNLCQDDLENLSKIESSPFLIPFDMARSAVATPIDMFGTVIRFPYEAIAFKERLSSKIFDWSVKKLVEHGQENTLLYKTAVLLAKNKKSSKTFFEELSNETKKASEIIFKNTADFIKPPEERQNVLIKITETVSQIVSQVAMGGAGLAVMGAQSYVQEQDYFRENGLYGSSGADSAAILTALLETIIERQTLSRGINKLNLGLGWKRAGIRMAINGLSEGVEEFTQSWATDLTNRYIAKDNKDFDEMWNESLAAGFYGLAGSLLFTGLTAIPSDRRNRRLEKIKKENKNSTFLSNLKNQFNVWINPKAGVADFDAIIPEKDDADVSLILSEKLNESIFNEPSLTMGALAELGDVAVASKTFQRTPEIFKNIVNQITKKNNTDTVYLNAVELKEIFEEESGDLKAILYQLGVNEDNFNEAVESGKDLKIKTGEYVAGLSKNEDIYQKVNQIARLKENSPSYNSVQEIVKRTMEDIEKFKQNQNAIKEPTEREKEIKKIYQSFYEIGTGLKLGKAYADGIAKIWAARANVATNGTQITPFEWLKRATKGRLIIKRGSKQAILTPDKLVIDRIPKNDLEQFIRQLRKPIKNKRELGASLLEFIAKKGGLSDIGGELKSMDADKWHKEQVGRGRLIRENGSNLDDMTLAAWEAGYFGYRQERPEINEFLELIRDELSGNRIYSQYGKAGEKWQEIEERDEQIEQIEEILSNYNLSLYSSSIEEIVKVLENYNAQKSEEYSKNYDEN